MVMQPNGRWLRRGRHALLWIACVAVGVSVAPAAAAVAWLVTLPVAPLLEALGWADLRTAAYDAGFVVPLVLVLAAYPLTRLFAGRFGLRAIGAHPPSPIPPHRRLAVAVQRVGRRQEVAVDLAMLTVEWLGVTTVPASSSQPTAIVVAVPPSATAADDDELDRLLTPPVHAERTRPDERIHRLAALAPMILVHAFWRMVRWHPRHRAAAAGALTAIGLVFVPSSIPLLERLLAAPVMGAVLAAVLAAMWAGRVLWARTARWLSDRLLGDPSASVTSPAWVIDLRDHDDDSTIDLRPARRTGDA